MMKSHAKGDTVGMTPARMLQRAAVCAASLPLALAFVPAASAATPPDAAGSGSLTVAVATDAWYAASSACTASPTGCLPAAPQTAAYPTKTLHAGATAGQEDSRTYLTLNLTALPAGTALSGGTLRLPISSGQDGSLSPDTATLQACAVTATFKDDVEGASTAPPAVDCKKATAPAKYVAAAGSAPEMYTVDLTPFASAWTLGAATQGIVLMPSAETAAGSTWHATFSAHDRDVPAPQHISALVTYASAAGDIAAPFDDSAAAVTPETGNDSASFAAPPLAPVASDSLPSSSVPATTPQIAPQAPPVPTVQQFQPQAAVTVGGFAYPAVFLLPILFAVGCGWLGRALTRDLQPAVV
jgi:hypothetical protein